MNIGSFLKAIGDLQPAASRALELRPGQTVRATVLEAHGKDGALLQIGDSQLLAKLETPLEPGQTAVLQVKGETDEGVIVLQLAARGAKSAAEAEAPKWKELAGQLGFGSGDKGAAELVKAIRAAGLPLSAETAEGLRTAAALKPAGVDAGEWLRAAASAMQRGMPLTSETLLGLRQALSGPPVHELLARLEQELAAMGSARPSDAAEGDGSLAKRAAGVGEAAAPAAPAAAVGQDAKQRPAGPTASLGAGAGEAAPLDGAAEAAKAGPAPLKAADAAARLLSLLQGGPWLEPAADAAAESLPGRGVPADGGGASGKGVLAGADGRHAAGAAKGGAALSAAAAQAAAAAVPAPQGGEPPAARAAAEAAAAASAAGAEGEERSCRRKGRSKHGCNGWEPVTSINWPVPPPRFLPQPSSQRRSRRPAPMMRRPEALAQAACRRPIRERRRDRGKRGEPLRLDAATPRRP
ncbi:hypothetical protein [Paenibacillus sp. B01]|uniref:hypothetical protein n=1 Tax=Paenibacillus sp. B01 TaxID=2660554 RepID=UPI00129A3BBE|nr:hypothetical protein [Paenibacillus sp. B01]QGG56675.1 hypothetical protein GE073_14505 [Paenibacillus sp. B01]